MKRPLIALAISLGLIVVGSAVCLPGICGCVSWLGIPDPEKFGGDVFIWVTFLGALGTVVSLCWLAGSAIIRAFGRDRRG